VARFKAARESQGLTLAEVAERMGIDAPALSRLETGKMLNPTLATLHKWAEALGQKLDVDLSSDTALGASLKKSAPPLGTNSRIGDAMQPKQKSYQALTNYLRLRLERLQSCHVLIEHKIYNDKIALFEGKANKQDASIGKILYHLEYAVGNTFRYTLLIGICSFLEEAIKAICQELIPAYETELKNIKTKKKNWLYKHMTLLSQCLAFDQAPIQKELDEFYDLITLRNCVAHSWGKIAKAIEPRDVEAAMQRLSDLGKAQNCSLVDVRDGFLVFGKDVIPHAIITAENISDAVLIATLKVSIT
jgi:transcriptional regulator with XRE-family HTH domain